MSRRGKNRLASGTINQAVAKLFEIAVGAPKLTFEKRKSAARLFELVVLAELLEEWKKSGPGRTVDIQTAINGLLRFAGAPASANRNVFSYFRLKQSGVISLEAWIGVQVTTLSWQAASGPTPLARSSFHEVDIGFFVPNIHPLPRYTDLRGLFSCKHMEAKKEHIREALGLRRETARLCWSQPSFMPWLVPQIVADPPVPLYLVSSSPNVYHYEEPVWSVGLYMAHVHYSY